MKSNILQLKAALIALALVGSLSSCKDEDAGPYIEKTVNLTEYTQLEVHGAMEVVISPDYAFDLRIEAPDNVMPSIEVSEFIPFNFSVHLTNGEEFASVPEMITILRDDKIGEERQIDGYWKEESKRSVVVKGQSSVVKIAKR